MEPAKEINIHANCIVIKAQGLLIRGASSSGKSTLSDLLIQHSRQNGAFARLVADDRVLVKACAGRLIARAHPAIAGRIERRGLGIEMVETLPAAVLYAILDLTSDNITRFPEPEAEVAALYGISLKRCFLGANLPLERKLQLSIAFLARL
jgi:HPr kinase/phosphorylase